MIEYCYQKTTHEELLDLIKWAQNVLSLRDWTITLDTGLKIPRRLMPGKDSDYEGLAFMQADRMFAEIWIPLDRLRTENSNPIEACCHELVHVLLNNNNGPDDDERLVRIISPLLYMAYCKAKGNRVSLTKDIQ